MFGSLGWRCEGGFFYAGVLPFGHEAWEIFGIGEEGEDELNGVGKPLFGLKCVAHVELVIRVEPVVQAANATFISCDEKKRRLVMRRLEGITGGNT